MNFYHKQELKPTMENKLVGYSKQEKNANKNECLGLSGQLA